MKVISSVGLFLVLATGCGGPIDEAVGTDESAAIGAGGGDNGGDPGGLDGAGKIVGCGPSSSGLAFSRATAPNINPGVSPAYKLYPTENDWFRIPIPAGFCLHHRIIFRRSVSTASMPAEISCGLYADAAVATSRTPSSCGLVGGSPTVCGIQFTTYNPTPSEAFVAISRDGVGSTATGYVVEYLGSIPCHENTADPFAQYDGGRYEWLNP